ncbi:MAG: hypothetical protein HOP06_04415 [Methylotenera sp.]|nr:hypothetical protein [Methylotenera sp.]
MVKYIKGENRFVDFKREISHWKKILFLGTSSFIFFFWLIPYGLRLLISLVMKNPEVKIENAGTQAIADGMNNIVSLVANVAIYGLKIFAVVLLLISIFGAIRSYIRSR